MVMGPGGYRFTDAALEVLLAVAVPITATVVVLVLSGERHRSEKKTEAPLSRLTGR